MAMLRSCEDRFFDRLIVGDECWEMLGAPSKSGYRQLAIEGHGSGSIHAHRVAYQIFRGPIPEGLELDHLCRNRGCVNPWHLEPVSTRENVLRGNGPFAVNARKTHCVNGHEFTHENTRWSKGMSRRTCKTCVRDRMRRYRKEARECA